MRVFLCIDLGEKRIGLATGSLDARLAASLGFIEHKSRRLDIERIQSVTVKNSVTDIVIGLSLQEDGTPNSMGRHALSFGKVLEETTGLPVTYWDETLSTRDAKDLRLETGASRKDRRGHQDALAAALILQSFFDSQIKQDFSHS
jgi:putative Holliday junction resolvase